MPLDDIKKAQTHRKGAEREQAAAKALATLEKHSPPTLIFEAFLLSNNLGRLQAQPYGALTEGLKEDDDMRRFSAAGSSFSNAEELATLRRLKVNAALSTWALRLEAFKESDNGASTALLCLPKPPQEMPTFRPPPAATDEALQQAVDDQLDAARHAARPASQIMDMLASVTVPARHIAGLMVPGRLDPYAKTS